MSEEKLYLKPNVVFEPLIDRWYAWAHLVSPATAAMNVFSKHLSVMESYIMAPGIHAEAVRNPKMRGGPFMDFSSDRVKEITALAAHTRDKRAGMIAFAKAVKELDKLLATEAKGFGLEELYARVPEILRGFVELFYDRNNNASFRFFEALLYKSDFYDKDAQGMAFWITNNDHRPFCLSTPRLDEPGVLHLPIPFTHPGIDELAKMRRVPQTLSYIKKVLDIPAQEETLFDSFFTAEPHRAYHTYSGDKIRMRYFGHACILVETRDVTILVDPLISYYGYHSAIDHFSDCDLPDVIDYVLITHNHQDHILFETLLPLRHKIRQVIVPRTDGGRLEDPNLRLMFTQLGFKQVTEIGEMETLTFADAAITGLPFMGEHSDLNIMAKCCHLVEISGFRLLFMADSRIMEPRLYRQVHRWIGDIDVLFLGMECDGAPLSWLYGPLMPRKMARDQDATRRLNGSDCERGVALVDIFHPREVYVYAMGQEPWVEFISSIKYTDESNPIVQSNQLISYCAERSIIAERLFGEKELLYERRETVPQVLAEI